MEITATEAKHRSIAFNGTCSESIQ